MQKYSFDQKMLQSPAGKPQLDCPQNVHDLPALLNAGRCMAYIVASSPECSFSGSLPLFWLLSTSLLQDLNGSVTNGTDIRLVHRPSLLTSNNCVQILHVQYPFCCFVLVLTYQSTLTC